MNEKDLVVLLLKQSDPSAMRDIFLKFHPSLCLLVHRITKDTDQAKDIVQEVFIKVWQNRHQLEITAFYYYDATSKSVRLRKQVGFIPLLSCRVEF